MKLANVDLAAENYIKALCGSLPRRYRSTDFMAVLHRFPIGYNDDTIEDNFYRAFAAKDVLHIICRCSGSVDEPHSDYMYYGQYDWELKNKDIIIHAFNNGNYREIYLSAAPTELYYSIIDTLNDRM